MPRTRASLDQPAVPARRARLSLDLWAVLLSLALALLVRLGLLHSIPW